jgi:hypothetical protein
MLARKGRDMRDSHMAGANHRDGYCMIFEINLKGGNEEFNETQTKKLIHIEAIDIL